MNEENRRRWRTAPVQAERCRVGPTRWLVQAALCLMALASPFAAFGCLNHQASGETRPRPVTVHEDVIYESPYTTVTRVRDSEGNTLRYQKRSSK